MKLSQILGAAIIFFPTLSVGVPIQQRSVAKRQDGASFSQKLDCVFLVGPWDCLNAKEDAETAAETAKSLTASGKLKAAPRNGEEDAFRHCYWNALMTIRFGEVQAKEVADSHEAHGQNPPNESKMDFFNNAKGREIGNLYKSKDYANSNAQSACLAEAHKGTLQTISSN